MPNDIIRIFKQGEIEKISKFLGDTEIGLSGTEIGHLLKSVDIPDVDKNNTKWKRLYNAFTDKQNISGSSNHILSFIAKALEPARFIGNSGPYSYLLGQINTVLSFHGLEFHDDGRFHKVKEARTLREAEKRALTLKYIIKERKLHSALLEFCNTELLMNNYFHAVLEASKGIAEMIRRKTGLSSDGAELVDAAFSGNNPPLKINSFSSDTDKSEQRGFVNLLKGLFGTFRNPTAHALKVEWNLSEQDAIDLFHISSYIFRRIDNSILNQ